MIEWLIDWMCWWSFVFLVFFIQGRTNWLIFISIYLLIMCVHLLNCQSIMYSFICQFFFVEYLIDWSRIKEGYAILSSWNCAITETCYHASLPSCNNTIMNIIIIFRLNVRMPNCDDSYGLLYDWLTAWSSDRSKNGLIDWLIDWITNLSNFCR